MSQNGKLCCARSQTAEYCTRGERLLASHFVDWLALDLALLEQQESRV